MTATYQLTAGARSVKAFHLRSSDPANSTTVHVLRPVSVQSHSTASPSMDLGGPWRGKVQSSGKARLFYTRFLPNLFFSPSCSDASTHTLAHGTLINAKPDMRVITSSIKTRRRDVGCGSK
jgi:hypothetical protein